MLSQVTHSGIRLARHRIQRVHVAQDCGTELLQVMLYTICNANRVFDIIYNHGVFIPANEAAKCASAGYALCVFKLQTSPYMWNS